MNEPEEETRHQVENVKTKRVHRRMTGEEGVRPQRNESRENRKKTSSRQNLLTVLDEMENQEEEEEEAINDDLFYGQREYFDNFVVGKTKNR